MSCHNVPVIDHVSLQVTDVARSRSFYQAVLTPLGFQAAYTDANWIGFADDERAPFWIGPAVDSRRPRELHIAFTEPFPNTTPTTSAVSCETRTATTSKPFATCPLAGQIPFDKGGAPHRRIHTFAHKDHKCR